MVLLGLSWYTAVSSALNDPLELEAHLAKAEELESKGIYVDAVAEYEAALEYEQRPDIYMKLANAYLQSGDNQSFVSVCQQQAEADPEDSQALDTLMEYYVENSNETDALQYLDGFLDQYPDNKAAQGWFIELEGSYEELYCRYETLSNIVNGSMVVSSEGLYGIVDASGDEIISCEYKAAFPFSADGFALVCREDDSWIYIDEDGQTRKVPDSGYESLGMFESDRTIACKAGKYGYLDENMEPVADFIWDQLSGFKENVGAGQQNGQWFLVDEDGEPKSEQFYEDVIMDEQGFCSSQNRIFVKENGSYRIINRKGETIGDLTFDDAKAFPEDGYAAVCKDGKWGFVNSDGELAIDYLFDDVRNMTNGFAAVCQDGLWGYIDSSGNLVIDHIFIEATDISEQGTAAVKQEDDGEQVWKLIQLNVFL